MIMKYPGLIEALKKFIPFRVRSFVRSHFILLDYDKYIWNKSRPVEEDEWVSREPQYPFKIGIIREFANYHKHYAAACREMGVSYSILDISKSKWIEAVRTSGCDAFLAWPSAALTIWKEMYDERLKIMVEEMGKLVYPSYKELWIYESKRRTRDWLEANQVPSPRTEIFYELKEALAFIGRSEMPIVIKTSQGASSKGVSIFRDRRKARNWIKKAFRKGITPRRGDPRDRHWGHVIMQEYLPQVKEWRMVRIANSYFGHPKGRVGDFHSGSGRVLWDTPPVSLLEFLKQVTDIGGFTSMDVDVFETRDGRYLVNELQTVFGASYSKDQLHVDGRPGRFLFMQDRNQWIFEEGDFARNSCANLRIEYLLTQLTKRDKREACIRK